MYHYKLEALQVVADVTTIPYVLYLLFILRGKKKFSNDFVYVKYPISNFLHLSQR